MKNARDGLFSQPGIFTYKKCVILVGAGISVSSGIPDFRSPDGIFSRLRKQLRVSGYNFFSYNFGIKEETREIYLKYISELKKLCDASSPNLMHEFLVSFPKSRIYTQNIDGLEEKAGMLFTRTMGTHGVYLHGNLSFLVCQYCGFKSRFDSEAVKALEDGDEIFCGKCTARSNKEQNQGRRKRPIGTMHPGLIHYHQSHPDGAFIGKLIEKDKDCDMFIVIGTSLKVDGIKKIVKLFAKSISVAGRRILVNKTALGKEWDGVFDYFYEGDCIDFIADYSKAKNIWISSKKANLTNKEIIQKIKKGKSKEGADCATTEPNISKPTCSAMIPLKKLSILKEEAFNIRQQDKLLDKLARISEMFDAPHLISQPVLNDALKDTCQPKIRNTSVSDAEYIAENANSSFVSLEDEFKSVINNEIKQKSLQHNGK